ncbi:polysaccharide biosynthesis protein [Gordonibacter sp. An230]|nr:polysaccharide biosynthesis protein [Gordonibacter sp. An230]
MHKRNAQRTPAPLDTDAVGAPSSSDSAPFLGASSRERERHASEKPPRRPNFITRSVNRWCNRLLGAVSERSLTNQEAEYAAHRTTRDYVWNTVGVGTWGMVFPVLTIVVTQLVGVEQAGMFSLAFITALMLMFVGNYGVRTYQASDIDEEHSFADYQVNRWITCVLMLAAGAAYCSVRGYSGDMLVISGGVYVYKMIDALADVYEGRLQQADKLYLAGVSQAFRSITVLVVFSFALLITRNLPVACVVMAIVAVATFLFLTLPLTLFETPKSRRASLSSVATLFKQCFPLFVALFMYNLIDNMPKFVMEGALSYDNQLYFNALYFPAHAILLTAGFVYKPLTMRMAQAWADPSKRKKFNIIIVAMLAMIIALTGAVMVLMSWIGIPIMGFLYGLDFEQFRELALIMLAAGGVTAAIEFIYQVITVLRRQRAVTKLYLITFGFSLFVPVLLVNFTGLPGAVIGYLIVMCILLMLLFWEYLRIRASLAREDAARAEEAQEADFHHPRPSEARAQRERRERAHAKRGPHQRAGAPSDEALDLAGGRARHGRRSWDDELAEE